MLASTTRLIRYLRLPAAAQQDVLRQAFIHAVWRGGSTEDARALLEEYLLQPFEATHTSLLPVFERHGDATIAQALFSVGCPGGELHPEAPPEILSVLARLGHPASKPLLTRYAFGPAEYYQAKHAALGLLHLDCRDLEQPIRAAIQATYHKNLFPEFIPALVCKLPDRAPMLARLYKSGTEYCSTDCNAGILLGFSLCGEEGAPYFRQALLNPAWEAHASGSGTRWYAYQGMLNLGLTFKELYQDVRQLMSKPTHLRYALQVLMVLLHLKVGAYPFAPDSAESFADLYSALFAPTDPSENLLSVAASVHLEEEVEQLETLLVLRLNQEVLLHDVQH